MTPADEKAKPTGLTQLALAGTAWSTLSTIGKQLLTLASVATVARMLGPAAYGLMAMAALVIAFISNFRDLGTATAIIQRPTVSRHLLSSLFWINVAVGLLMCITVAATAQTVASFFRSPELAGILRVLSLSLWIASASVVHNAILTRAMLFKAVALTELVAALAGYLVALTCAYAGLGVWSLVFASVTSSLTNTIGYWAGARFAPRFEFNWSEVKSIAGFSSNLSAFGIVNYACRNVDNLIVGKVLGSVSLGFYQMAYNLMLTPIQNISTMISQVLFPAFSRIQDDSERFRHAYVRGCMVIALLTFPVMAGLGVVADPLIRAVLGPKWIGAIPIFQILVPVGLVQSVQTTVGIVYQAKGRTDLLFRWGLLVLVAVTSAFLVGVRFGAVGVAAAYAIVYVIFLIYPGFALCFRLIGIRFRDFVSALLPQLMLTISMSVICYAWLMGLRTVFISNLWVQLLSTALLGATVYVAGLFLFRLKVLEYVHEIVETSENPMLLRGLAAVRRLTRRARS
jgi:O-antigen/teichoic acid export membrane protein